MRLYKGLRLLGVWRSLGRPERSWAARRDVAARGERKTFGFRSVHPLSLSAGNSRLPDPEFAPDFSSPLLKPNYLGACHQTVWNPGQHFPKPVSGQLVNSDRSLDTRAFLGTDPLSLAANFLFARSRTNRQRM